MSFVPKVGEVYEYEFTEAHNEIISGLARFMQITGIIILLYGVVEIARGALAITQDGWAEIIGGVVSIVISILTLRAASFFRQIVDTRGEDLDHLMDALGTLRSLYKLQTVLYILAVIGTVLALLIGLKMAG